METIICSKCGKEIEIEVLQGDYSTFVCESCQEEINRPAYINELEELSLVEDKTESQLKRIEFLNSKIG
jgi:hypothetical protein